LKDYKLQALLPSLKTFKKIIISRCNPFRLKKKINTGKQVWLEHIAHGKQKATLLLQTWTRREAVMMSV
jgi:hypothetical protein